MRSLALALLVSVSARAADAPVATLPDAGRDAPALPDGGVAGSLPRQHIFDVIHAGRAPIRKCYERDLGREIIDGTLVIRFVIAPDGSVSSAEVYRDTLQAPAVAECVLSVARGWRFHAPVGGSVVVTYPLVFKAVAEVAGARPDGGSPSRLVPRNILSVVRDSGARIRDCFEQRAAEWGAGRLDLHFVVAADGSVASLDLQSERAQPQLTECVRSVARGWRFQRPTGGAPVDVVFPLLTCFADDDDS